jgi:hypothetical protein
LFLEGAIPSSPFHHTGFERFFPRARPTRRSMHLNYTRAGPRAVTAITRELTFARKKIVQVVSRSRGNQLRFADAAEIDSSRRVIRPGICAVFVRRP